MKTDDFDYELPEELIAQVPLKKEMHLDLWCYIKKRVRLNIKHLLI